MSDSAEIQSIKRLFDADKEALGAYLQATKSLKEESDLWEPDWRGWDEDKLAAWRWLVAERLLQTTTSQEQLQLRLGYVGMTLAEFAPDGYNKEQVAKDSDGREA